MKGLVRRVFGWFERRWIPDSGDRAEHERLVRERLREEPHPVPDDTAPDARPAEVDRPPSDP